jgi:hypothetical protein
LKSLADASIAKLIGHYLAMLAELVREERRQA